MNKLIKIFVLSIGVILWFVVLLNHTEDGNIFGLYMINSTLYVGDFWGALYIVLFPIKILNFIGVKLD